MTSEHVDQAQLWYNQLLEAGKLPVITNHLKDRKYPYPDASIAHSLRFWANNDKTFADADALEAALKREYSKQAGQAGNVQSSWGKEA